VSECLCVSVCECVCVSVCECVCVSVWPGGGQLNLKGSSLSVLSLSKLMNYSVRKNDQTPTTGRCLFLIVILQF